nr:MAG TPA: hypothetical protein [Caudoviricetes sp.]
MMNIKTVGIILSLLNSEIVLVPQEKKKLR